MPAPFRAEIHLSPTTAGGRSGPLPPSEWRMVLGVDEQYWSARFSYVGNPAPGDTFLASVQLLFSEGVQHFPVGGEFTIWEGGKKGVGRVLSHSA